jgi:hypothetical protein
MLMKKQLPLTVLFVVAWLTSPGLADDQITGEWELTMDFGGQKVLATLTVSEKDDGAYTAKWGSNELSDVKFDGGKLTFVQVRRFGDREFTSEFSGTLEDGKLAGVLKNPQGELEVNGVRPVPKSPVLGRWDISFKVQDRDMTARMSVTQADDGTLGAEWTADFGEFTVNSISFQDGELKVERTVKVQDREFDSTYVAEVEGNTLTGKLVSDFGEIPANGTRLGSELIGTWELTATSDGGTRTQQLKVYPDLTGRYELFFGEVPVELTLEGKDVSFHIEMSFGDRTFETDFTGTLDGDSLSGELTSPRGTSQISGKKLEPASSAT